MIAAVPLIRKTGDTGDFCDKDLNSRDQGFNHIEG
jgi:hypothetical protein